MVVSTGRSGWLGTRVVPAEGLAREGLTTHRRPGCRAGVFREAARRIGAPGQAAARAVTRLILQVAATGPLIHVGRGEPRDRPALARRREWRGSAPGALVRAVCSDPGAVECDRLAGEQAAAVNLHSSSGRDRVAGDQHVGQAELRSEVLGVRDGAVPDPAAERLAGVA